MTNVALKPGEVVFPTNAAAAEDPKLKEWWRGIQIESITESGVATVTVTSRHEVHVSKLTTNTSGDAYDPIL